MVLEDLRAAVGRDSCGCGCGLFWFVFKGVLIFHRIITFLIQKGKTDLQHWIRHLNVIADLPFLWSEFRTD